jgi:hypothetical protein
MKKASRISLICGTPIARRRDTMRWFDYLSPADQEEAREIRKQVALKSLPKKIIAERMIKEFGLSVKYMVVSRWLGETDE